MQLQYFTFFGNFEFVDGFGGFTESCGREN
jgi:hypothetical protein